jgi:hypothetical protein
MMVKGGLIAGCLAPLLGLELEALAAPVLIPLDSKDPAAIALAYTPNTADVDEHANPTHARDQKCANCVQFKGAPTDPTGACNIFVGKSVTAAGWCKLWASPESAMPD